MIDLHLATQKLKSIGQEHLLKYWDSLSKNQRELLLHEILHLDVHQFLLQQRLLQEKALNSALIEPVSDWIDKGNSADLVLGKKLIAEGKVAALLIAGGQGTRLGFKGPKGLYPISQVKGKTLFQLFAEKTVAAGRQVDKELCLAVMTSPENDEQVRGYFETHHRFGLKEDQLTFFCQTELPFLDEKGNAFLESPCEIARGPDGNGTVFNAFVKAGLLESWKAKGIGFVNIILVDNPLADPFDSEFVGFHHRNQLDVTVRAVLKQRAEEKVGVLAKCQGRLCVKEYTELATAEREACDSSGRLVYCCANISEFCLSLDFISEIAEKDFPLHKAFKKAKYLDEQGSVIDSTEPNAWKFEKFIFDLLSFTNRAKALVYPRNQCFAPLKNAKGENSQEVVQQALLNRDKQVIQELTGMAVDMDNFELSQDFYYPTETLKKEWEGKKIPRTSYIEP